MSTWLKHLLILLLIAVFFRGKGIYLVLYGLMAVYVALGWVMKSALRRVQVERRCSTARVFPDESVTVQLTVKNHSWFPLTWLDVSDDVPPGFQKSTPTRFVCSLGGKSTQQFQYELQALKRGLYRFKDVTVSTHDLFGIHYDEQMIPVTSQEEPEIVVYPRVRPLSQFGLANDFLLGGYGKARRAMPDPLNIVGTRDYITFESIRHVHWKMSAHTGSLHVKQFAPTKHLDVSLLLDLGKDRFDSWNESYMCELAIEVAASILYAVGKKRSAFDLTVIGRLPAEGHQAHDLIHIAQGHSDNRLLYALEILAQIEATPHEDIETMWAQLMNQRREMTWVIITPDIEKLGSQLNRRSIFPMHRTQVIEISDRSRRPSIPAGLGFTRISYAGEIRSLAAGSG